MFEHDTFPNAMFLHPIWILKNVCERKMLMKNKIKIGANRRQWDTQKEERSQPMDSLLSFNFFLFLLYRLFVSRFVWVLVQLAGLKQFTCGYRFLSFWNSLFAGPNEIVILYMQEYTVLWLNGEDADKNRMSTRDNGAEKNYRRHIFMGSER